MANFSNPNPFQPLKRYVSVRLQQGVPLVDADWNEKEDIRRFELQAFLKWFVGNGVPTNSNAFLIRAKQTGTNDQGEPTYATDDFIISGVGISPNPDNPTPADYLNAGRCLVEGQDVFITDDIDFKQQPLYQGNTPNKSEIIDPSAPAITPIPITARQEHLLVYLDVWEWDVEAEDLDLLNQVIGMRTCLRKRRDWAVRVGTTVPPANATHSYLPLATLSHGSQEPISSGDIRDMRQIFSLSGVRDQLDSLSEDVTDARERISTAERDITGNTQDITNAVGRVARAEQRLDQLEDLLLHPSIENFSPRRGQPGTAITFTGRNFQLTTARPVVSFGQTVAQIVGTPTNTSLVATVPAMAPGTVSVSIETPYGIATAQFVVQPTPDPRPEITSFSPTTGASGTAVTIVGNNFGTAGITVRFGTTQATIVGTPTNTEIVARVPDMSDGSVFISVATPSGSATSTASFEVRSVPAPEITNFSPRRGARGVAVTITGLNFMAPTVYFGDTKAALVVSPTQTQIVVSVPDMSAGNVPISVTTAGGTATTATPFQVMPPA